MNPNFKPLEDLFNTLSRQQTNNTRNDNRAKFRVATIRSIQGTTATISFGNSTLQIPGIPITDGLTLVANNIVEVQNSVNGIQNGSFVITRKIADS